MWKIKPWNVSQCCVHVRTQSSRTVMCIARMYTCVSLRGSSSFSRDSMWRKKKLQERAPKKLSCATKHSGQISHTAIILKRQQQGLLNWLVEKSYQVSLYLLPFVLFCVSLRWMRRWWWKKKSLPRFTEGNCAYFTAVLQYPRCLCVTALFHLFVCCHF